LIALILVVLVITYFSIVCGELIPKRIAVNEPDDVVCRLSPAIRSLTKLLGPITKVLSASTNFGIKLLHIDLQGEPPITEDEIRIYLDEGRDVGVIEPAESDMFSGVFRLGDRRVDALMTPRTELVWIDIEDDIETIIQEITQSDYSRIPVGRGDLDHIVGMLDIKDLVGVDLHDPAFNLEGHLKEPLFIPENLPALNAFEKFRSTGIHQALVIDEYGGVQGMVTLYDVLESIVGEIPLEPEDRDQEVVQRADGSYLFDGMLPIDEVKELLDLDELPDETRVRLPNFERFCDV